MFHDEISLPSNCGVSSTLRLVVHLTHYTTCKSSKCGGNAARNLIIMFDSFN